MVQNIFPISIQANFGSFKIIVIPSQFLVDLHIPFILRKDQLDLTYVKSSYPNSFTYNDALRGVNICCLSMILDYKIIRMVI